MDNFNNLYRKLMESVVYVEKFDPEMGSSKKIDADELIDYINRVIARKENPKEKNSKMKLKDYLHMPHIHASIAKKVSVTLKTLKPLKNPYDQLWVRNPYKPKEFSISKTLTDQMSQYKKDDRDDSVNLSGEKYNQIREVAKDLVKWSGSYGMSSDDELWATGVEDFLKLPKYHRQKIIQLMYK